ncbi:MAG: exonuclease SbcCD subunit D C-terminal domain-containing protein, partial [Selenomonadaceae bacterium]|nr:exonuclease SbcCD subunit D C-terminal domain-containing protein [Selenomonadaceae bacterium]
MRPIRLKLEAFGPYVDELEIDFERELGADGRAALEFLPLTPKHDLLVIEGMIEDVLTRTPMTDYVAVRLLNREQVLNARAKLEELFPNLLAIEKVNFLRETSTGGGLKRAEGASVLDQFKDFFEYQTGDRLDSDQEAA